MGMGRREEQVTAAAVPTPTCCPEQPHWLLHPKAGTAEAFLMLLPVNEARLVANRKRAFLAAAPLLWNLLTLVMWRLPKEESSLKTCS